MPGFHGNIILRDGVPEEHIEYEVGDCAERKPYSASTAQAVQRN
jgi:hypothetical protein